MLKLTKRQFFGIGILLTLVGTGLFIYLSLKTENVPQDAIYKKVKKEQIVGVDKGSVDRLKTMEKEFEKINNFIYSYTGKHGRYDSIELTTNGESHKEVFSDENLRKEIFDVFFASLKNNDVDLFIRLFSEEAIAEVWDGEIDIEKRLAIIRDYMDLFSRKGKVQNLEYHFAKDQYKNTSEDGVLYLTYNDGRKVSIPFEVKLIQSEADIEDEHKYYLFVSSMKDMAQYIEDTINE